MEKRLMLLFSSAVLLVITFVTVIVFMIFSDPSGKYTIYAADRVYYCNQFQVAGRTIYFKDTDDKNVCINGDYTLIYEND